MGTMLYVLDGHKDQNAIRDAMGRARAALHEAAVLVSGERVRFGEREQVLLELANEAVRLNLQEELEAVAGSLEADHIRVDGVEYKRHQSGCATYHSLCGPIRVSRATFRESGVRNGPTLVALDLKVGIVERATPALAHRIALGYAQAPSRQVEEQLRACVRQPPSRSTLERIAKAIGTRANARAVEIDEVVRHEETLPSGIVAISVGIDRTTVPMEEPRPRGVAPAPRRRTKPYERRKPAPVHVQYRMAYVGTVSVVGVDAEPLQTWRYAASAEEGPQRVLASLIADIRNVQKKHKSRLPVGVVQDGAPELWNLMRMTLRNAGMSGWFEVIDRYHLMEHLAAAVAGFPKPLVEREKVLRSWRRKLNRDDNAMEKITSELRSARAERLECYRKSKRPFDLQCAATIASQFGYLEGHRKLFRYAGVIHAGLPIGSGATEGACKSLIMIRTKGCGQRWKTTGIRAVLALRGQYTSGRMPLFWQAYAAEYEAEVRPFSRAA